MSVGRCLLYLRICALNDRRFVGEVDVGAPFTSDATITAALLANFIVAAALFEGDATPPAHGVRHQCQ